MLNWLDPWSNFDLLLCGTKAVNEHCRTQQKSWWGPSLYKRARENTINCAPSRYNYIKVSKTEIQKRIGHWGHAAWNWYKLQGFQSSKCNQSDWFHFLQQWHPSVGLSEKSANIPPPQKKKYTYIFWAAQLILWQTVSAISQIESVATKLIVTKMQPRVLFGKKRNPNICFYLPFHLEWRTL